MVPQSEPGIHAPSFSPSLDTSAGFFQVQSAQMTSLLRAWNELDLARHKAEFYRMWYTGYEAGLSHVNVLSTMGDFRRSSAVRALRDGLLRGAHQRSTIVDTIRGHPELVVPFEAGLLELGEETGRLEAILKALGDHFTAEHRRMLWVKKKLAYPMANVFAATFIVPFPVLFFGDAARYVMVVATELVALVLFGGALLTAATRRYERQRRFMVGRLCRALALTVEAGLSLDRVSTLAAAAAGDPELIAHVNRERRREPSGQSLAETFRGTSVVPREVVAALEVADASGDYHHTVRKLADLYDGGY